MKLLDSLRRRLVLSMLLVFALGLAMACVERPAHQRDDPPGHGDVDMLPEPYQDMTVLLTFTIIAIGTILVVSHWTLRHLQAASDEAAHVGPRNPQARITVKKLPREIRPMVAAVNAALDRMSQGYNLERRFVADAAHELRTPLTVLSLRLQQMRVSSNPDWQQIDRDLRQMSHVVGQLLELARREAGDVDLQSDFKLVDAGRAAREAAALTLPLAERAGRHLEFDLPDRLPVRACIEDLRDVFRNLLENAIIHGEGVICVAGRCHREGDRPAQLVITVADQGTGLSSLDWTVLFERFRKVDATSSGSGLGLAIVREIVRIHGGVVVFAPGPETIVEVRLPSA